MKLSPRATADLANAISRALGLKDESGALLAFEEPRSARATDVLYVRLGAALDARRPSKHAPPVGHLLAVLASSCPGASPRSWPRPPTGRAMRSRDAAKRALAELTEVVAQGSFERTKRAERGRVLGELLLLFDLESLVGAEVDPAMDVEEALRAVRRALASR